MSSTFTFHPLAVFPYSSWISNTDLSIFFGYVSGCCPDLILVCVCVRTRRTQRLKTLVDCEKAIESLETVARLDAIKQGHIAEIPIGQALNFIHSISRISAPAELHSKVMKLTLKRLRRFVVYNKISSSKPLMRQRHSTYMFIQAVHLHHSVLECRMRLLEHRCDLPGVIDLTLAK